jgi:hypothetical protein
VAQQSNLGYAAPHPKNASAYPLLKQNEGNQKKPDGRHRDGSQEHHYQNFLQHINLLLGHQRGEEL